MPAITNIAAYKFATLRDLPALRRRLLAQCKGWHLKGTILLSTEGINLFVAGAAPEIDLLLAELRATAGLGDLTPKFSASTEQPFSRMLVRIKKEIIAFGVAGINPALHTSPKLPARTLKQWLDEGRPITLLDTRNDYEVKLGTFQGAYTVGIDHFREFPLAVQRLPEDLKGQPIVLFCTGGIRCEKAGPFLEREGFREVFQLDGGILKYFEECGGAHYEGECFVFDQRVGLDARLQETPATQCFHCLTPLTAMDQRDARYVPPDSCPYCFVTTDDRQARAMRQRHETIRRVTTPLPGSRPYDNFRPVTVPANLDRATLLDFFGGILPHVPRGDWAKRGAQGLLRNASREPVSGEHRVRAGERYFHVCPATVEPEINPDVHLLHEDEAIIVLHKPAPLPMHPSGRFNRNTLQFILHEAYHPQKPRPAHRLDANTTGLVVCARTRYFAGLLQPQFARGEVEKTYLARVSGQPASQHFFCDLPISTEPGECGAREIDAENGLPARTEFTVLERWPDGSALLQVQPLTGRTNQIRVHLWQLGFPIRGDQLYLPAQKFGVTQTRKPKDSPLCLHAWRLSFQHPLTRERVTFETEKPVWAQSSAA